MHPLTSLLASPWRHLAAPARPRVAVLRSSRFFPQAVAACRERWPGADVRVVYQPGSEAEYRSAGVAESGAWAYPGGGAFTPWRMRRSPAGRALRRYGPNAIVIQWDRRNGPVRGPLVLSALQFTPAGVHVFHEDGSWSVCDPFQWSATTIARAWRGTAVVQWMAAAPARVRRRVPGLILVPAVLVASLVATPAWLWSRACERVRLAAGHALGPR